MVLKEGKVNQNIDCFNVKELPLQLLPEDRNMLKYFRKESKMNLNNIYTKALNAGTLTTREGLDLYNNAPTEDLMFIANLLRQKLNPGNEAGWMIDRNVNITNVCFSQCSFCNFCRKKNSDDAYVTSEEEYIQKINELYYLGGDQLLLQGGMNPDLGIDFYTNLFRKLKSLYPTIKLHALGPPEVVYLSKREHFTHKQVLHRLIESGLDSLPGAGAEILSDRVRKIVSPGKATSKEWLNVIESSIITCDAFLAMIDDNFKNSNWCDQEAGFAFGIGMPIIPVRLGIDPYGFIGKFQGIQGKGKMPIQLANEIWKILIHNEKCSNITSESFVNIFCNIIN